MRWTAARMAALCLAAKQSRPTELAVCVCVCAPVCVQENGADVVVLGARGMGSFKRCAAWGCIPGNMLLHPAPPAHAAVLSGSTDCLPPLPPLPPPQGHHEFCGARQRERLRCAPPGGARGGGQVHMTLWVASFRALQPAANEGGTHALPCSQPPAKAACRGTACRGTACAPCTQPRLSLASCLSECPYATRPHSRPPALRTASLPIHPPPHLHIARALICISVCPVCSASSPRHTACKGCFTLKANTRAVALRQRRGGKNEGSGRRGKRALRRLCRQACTRGARQE